MGAQGRLSPSTLGCFALGAALLVSVGFNLRGPRPAVTRAPAAPADESLPTAATGDGAACQAELDRCRRDARAESALRALAAMPGTTPEPLAPRPLAAADGGGARRGETGTGLDAQQRALCKIAEGHVRALWALNRDAFVATLSGIGTDAFARKWTDDAVGKLTTTLGLRAEERRRLEQGYGTIWSKRGAAMQARLRAQPQDFAGLLEDVRAFWREEDELIARQVGDGARDDFRASELGTRTAIAGMLGTFAGRTEYDESSAW